MREEVEAEKNGRLDLSGAGHLVLTLLQGKVAYWQVNGQVHELC